MNSRALLTALLFGSAIAGTRLVAHAPEPQPQKPERQKVADGTLSIDAAQAPRRAG